MVASPGLAPAQDPATEQPPVEVSTEDNPAEISAEAKSKRDRHVALLIFFFGITITGSFLCSVWESTLLSVSQPYVGNLLRQEGSAGRKLSRLKSNVGRPLTSILTMNTIANTAGPMGVAAQVGNLTDSGIWNGLASVWMVISVLVAGEIVPKNLGARHWRILAPFVAHCLTVLNIIFCWMIWIVELVNKGNADIQNFDRDELKAMAFQGLEEGELDEGESRVLQNLLRLRDTRVHNIMTPRVVVFSLKEETTVKEYLDRYVERPFSRILLHEGDPDHMTGFALKDDILLAAARNQYDSPLGSFRREIISLPASTTISWTFDRLLGDHQHIALVHDEFGSLKGIITMEDVVETLVGLEIVDEVDKQTDLQEWARQQWKKRAQRMGIEWEVVENGGNRDASSKSESSDKPSDKT